MLDEPPPHQYDLNFSLGGIGVRVSPGFWLIAVLLGATSNSIQSLLIWVAVLFVSIIIHEIGHVLAFRRYGIPSRVVLYHFGGLAIPDEFSWRRKPLSHQQNIVVSLAGPMAGFVFAAVALVIAQSSGGVIGWWIFPRVYNPELPGWVNGTIIKILWINIFWGLMNLAPLYPLDGGKVARAGLMLANPANGLKRSLQVSVVTGAVLALVGLGYFTNVFMALMFGMLALQNYQSLKEGWNGFR